MSIPLRQRLLAAILLGAGLLAAHPCLAATYYVSPDGNNSNPGTLVSPWLTIQKAADTMVAGDTVLIRGGAYYARVTLTRSGTAGNPITYRNFPNEIPILDGAGIAGLGIMDGLFAINTRSYTTVAGLTVQNSQRAGIAVGNAGNVTIEDCIIHDTGLAGSGGSGIWADGKTESGPTIIRRNTIYYTNPGGITIWTGNRGGHFLIEGNTVHDWTGSGNYDGIQGGDTPYVIVRNNVVHSKGSGPDGDYIDFGGNAGVGLTHHIIYDGNVVYRGTGPATAQVKLNNAPTSIIIRRNVLHQVQLSFYEQPYTRAAIYSNTIVEATSPNAGDALQLWNGASTADWHGPVFKNNIFAFSGDYLLFHGITNKSGAYPNLVFDNNVYRFSTKGIYWFSTDGERIYHAETSGAAGAAAFDSWRAATGQEPSGGKRTEATLNQLFVDPSSLNFRLIAGSPAVDAGGALTTTTASGTGTVIPVGESFYFTDGYGMAPGDVVRIGTTTVRITAVDDTGNTLTVNQAITWASGAPVSLPYTGSAPDAGAYEVGPAAPTNLRIIPSSD